MTTNLHRLFFKPFSNDTRLAIINLLKHGPLTVQQICDKTRFEQSRVSHNLRCLEHCGFVVVRREGRWRRYSLDRQTILPIVRLLDAHIRTYQSRLRNCTIIRQ